MPTPGLFPSLRGTGSSVPGRSASVPPPRRGRRRKAGLAAEAAKLLQQTFHGLDPAATTGSAARRAWGSGPLGSVLDAPLASAPGTSHKPPMLGATEERIIQALNALHHRYREEPWLLPVAPPPAARRAADDTVDDEALLKSAPAPPGRRNSQLPQLPPVGSQSVGMLVDDGDGDSSDDPYSRARSFETLAGSFLPAEPKNSPAPSPEEVSPPARASPPPDPPPQPRSEAAVAREDSVTPEGRYRQERLGAFRSAARFFVNSFRTYRPLLTWILAEYEDYYAFLTACFAGLRHDLALTAAERDATRERLEEHVQKHAREKRALEKEAAAQRRKADRIRAEMERWHATQKQSMAELRMLQESLEEAEDVKAHLQNQVSRMERQLHEDRSDHHERSKAAQLEKDLADATGRCTEVQRLHEIVLRENRFLKDRVEELQQQARHARARAGARSARRRKDDPTTPRPAWDQPPVDGVVMYIGQSTAASVEAAAFQILDLERQVAQAQAACATGDGQAAFNVLNKRWLLGLGTSTDINPPFLRCTGRYQNLRLRKPQVEGLVKEFWKEKGRTKDTHKMRCGEFFPVFLKRKFGDAKVNEYAYNIWYALLRYRADPDCDLFYRLLKGDADEALWHVQAHMLSRVADAFNEADLRNDRRLDRDSIMACIRELFPAKEEGALAALESTLSRAHDDGDGIPYTELFEEDEDCSQHPFVEMLRAQYVAEADEYILELEEAVVEFDECSDGVITPAELARAVWALDPNFPGPKMDDFVARAFQVTLEVLKPQANPLSGKRNAQCIGERTYGCGDSVKKPLAPLLQRVRDLVHAGFLQRQTRRSALDASTLHFRQGASRQPASPRGDSA
eukprot:TRINITY_DN66069_c0_g1_i1.p1 TRINITY_DN66069_c0_g1~~TRINITY_DN66069_c0_g1_i1.p1  ORF type:complete len:886 (+),score=328.67 TRINITY_DN66069_c0_g1_i1:91-2658(+)